MAELEALCAGIAAERMTAVERTALEAAHEELRALIQSGDPRARAAVSPRAIPQSRPAGQVACRT
jgi:DNA-binding GntR family transcriptional regulator